MNSNAAATSPDDLQRREEVRKYMHQKRQERRNNAAISKQESKKKDDHLRNSLMKLDGERRRLMKRNQTRRQKAVLKLSWQKPGLSTEKRRKHEKNTSEISISRTKSNMVCEKSREASVDRTTFCS
mmetsp:Transcript_14200/g.18074  ORF Transcript_14200/g.18074 Transcript_14200/m.18074 type:complete len:126 (-) Transcript_14200:67-444(-)